MTATTVSPPIPLVNKKPKRMFTIKMNTPNATSTPSRPINEQQQQQQPPKRPDILSICREYSLNRSSTMSKSMLTTMMTPSSEKKKFSIKWNSASSSLSSSATSAVAATTSKRIRSDPIMDLLRNKVADKSAIKSWFNTTKCKTKLKTTTLFRIFPKFLCSFFLKHSNRFNFFFWFDKIDLALK